MAKTTHKEGKASVENIYGGIACPKCKRAGSEVIRTENYEVIVMRKRSCRDTKCGNTFWTSEGYADLENPRTDPRQAPLFDETHP
jgi:hypothetical protein